MKNSLKRLASICLLLTAGNACFSVGIPTVEKGGFRPSEWVAVSNENLDKVRGGFDVGSGVAVSFGIVRTVTINGDIVNRTSFNLPDVSKITPDQAKSASAAIAQAGIVQSGVGNFVDSGVKSQLAGGTLIQNSLNDQKIQTLTVINAGVSSMGLLRAINVQTALKDALFGSMSVR